MSTKGTLLFILTSHSQLGTTGKTTGYYLPEVAHPLHVLSKHYNIRYATPLGGKSPLDPSSLEAFRDDPTCKEFLNNAKVTAALENTEKLSDLSAADIDQLVGVFFPGGHGPMFDLADNKEAANIVAKVYERGGVVGAVCHGPAGLVNVKVNNGERYLVDGHDVTGFSNAEEDQVQLSSQMPFMLEDRLREHGGKYSKAAEPWGEHVVGKGTRLLTGQNPASSFAVANAIVEALAKKND